MFETTGTVDERLLKEIRKYMIMPRPRALIQIFMSVAGILSLVCLFIQAYLLALILGIAVAGFLLEGVVIRNILIKRALDRMKECNRIPETVYTTSLSEVGVEIQNRSNNANATINYEVIVKFVETKSAYFLFTKSWQFIAVFKGETIQKEKLVQFLKEHPTKIKW